MDLTEASPNNSALRADRPLGHRERATGSAPSAAGGGAVAPPGGRSPPLHPPAWQRARCAARLVLRVGVAVPGDTHRYIRVRT